MEEPPPQSIIEILIDKVHQLEFIVHHSTVHIPMIVVFQLENGNSSYSTIMQKKEDCRPTFWLLGGMCHLSKGKIGDGDPSINSYSFDDALCQYRQFEDQINLFDDELRLDQEYYDTVDRLKEICNEIRAIIEENHWEKAWFISFEYVNYAATSDDVYIREYYSTDILFTYQPAFNVCMYLLKYKKVAIAARAYTSENIQIEDTIEYKTLNAYA